MKKKLYPFLMMAPFILLVTVFFIVPVILTVVMSFTDMGFTLEWSFAGFANFVKIAKDIYLPEIIGNTLVYVGCTLAVNVIISLLFAVLTSYFITKESHSLFYRAFWMLPRMTPSTVIIFMWVWFFAPTSYGFLNAIISGTGGQPVNWLMEYPMAAAILVNACIGISFGMLIFSSAIKTIPQDLYLSARVDGAKDSAIVFGIILPAIKWQVMYVTIAQTLSLMTSYEYIMLLTNGGPLYSTTVWSLYAYRKAFKQSEFGYGATLSLLLVVVSVSLALVLLRAFKFDKLMKTTRID